MFENTSIKKNDNIMEIDEIFKISNNEFLLISFSHDNTIKSSAIKIIIK